MAQNRQAGGIIIFLKMPYIDLSEDEHGKIYHLDHEFWPDFENGEYPEAIADSFSDFVEKIHKLHKRNQSTCSDIVARGQNWLLKIAIEQDDLDEVGYDITDELEMFPNSFLATEPILRLMEKYPDADFGMPGPLVHFVELFSEKGYEEKLVESIKRCPTQHTVWMLNRVINGV